MTLKAWSIKEQFDELDFTEVKTSCSSKDTVNRMIREVTDWKKIFAKHVYRNIFFKTLKTKQEENNPIKKVDKRFEQIIHQRR